MNLDAQFVFADLQWLVVAALFIAGWAVIAVTSKRRLNRAISDLRSELQAEINALYLLLRTYGESAQKIAPASVSPAVVPEAKPVSTEITPETVLIIAAAVTAFLGKKVRVRSAKLLQTPYELINPWAQQGRVVVQASHNLPQRSHWNDLGRSA